MGQKILLTSLAGISLAVSLSGCSSTSNDSVQHTDLQANDRNYLVISESTIGAIANSMDFDQLGHGPDQIDRFLSAMAEKSAKPLDVDIDYEQGPWEESIDHRQTIQCSESGYVELEAELGDAGSFSGLEAQFYRSHHWRFANCSNVKGFKGSLNGYFTQSDEREWEGEQGVMMSNKVLNATLSHQDTTHSLRLENKYSCDLGNPKNSLKAQDMACTSVMRFSEHLTDSSDLLLAGYQVYVNESEKVIDDVQVSLEVASTIDMFLPELSGWVKILMDQTPEQTKLTISGKDGLVQVVTSDGVTVAEASWCEPATYKSDEFSLSEICK